MHKTRFAGPRPTADVVYFHVPLSFSNWQLLLAGHFALVIRSILILFPQAHPSAVK
jgi:hypothetical protein